MGIIMRPKELSRLMYFVFLVVQEMLTKKLVLSFLLGTLMILLRPGGRLVISEGLEVDRVRHVLLDWVIGVRCRLARLRPVKLLTVVSSGRLMKLWAWPS